MINIPVQLKVSPDNKEFFDYVSDLRKRKLSNFLVLLLKAYYYEPAIQTLVNKYMEENVTTNMSCVHVKDQHHEQEEEKVSKAVNEPTVTNTQPVQPTIQLEQLSELTALVGQLKDLLEPVSELKGLLEPVGELTQAATTLKDTTNNLALVRDDLGALTFDKIPEVLKQKDTTIETLSNFLDKEIEFKQKILAPLMSSQASLVGVTGVGVQQVPVQQVQPVQPIQQYTQPVQQTQPVEVQEEEPLNIINVSEMNQTTPVQHTAIPNYGVQPVQQQAEPKPKQRITPLGIINQTQLDSSTAPVQPQVPPQPQVVPQQVAQQEPEQSKPKATVDPLALFKKTVSSVNK